MWNSKIVVWLEQKLIALTSALYVKRREVAPVVEQIAPTLEKVRVAPSGNVGVGRTPTKPKITKTTAVAKKTKTIAKPAVKKAAPKKPAVKKAPAIKPKTKAKAK